MPEKIRFLSADDVLKALPMPDAIDAMKAAFQQLAAGQAEMPLRGRVSGAEDGITLLMPAYLKESQALGVKIVSVFPHNPAKNKPIIHALVMLLDANTGQPLALLEGGTLTAIRTGAGSGAATDALARHDSRVVTIIGAGVQARTQLVAVCAVRQIEQVYVSSRNRDHAERFALEMGGHFVLGLSGQVALPKHITVTDTPYIRESDIICTATTSTEAVFDGKDLQAGTHINAVGSYTPQMREVDSLTLQKALIVMDSREAVLAEAGEIIHALETGAITENALHAELGEILNGTKVGRTSPEQITYFKSCGIAIQDAAAAQTALRNAESMGLGTLLDW